jgi:prolyl-tRNA editing enzyme YbaK/EbsC (Cys-tRNA(Pro) deacylase)
VTVARTQAFLDERAPGLVVIEPDADTSTVPLAAAALGVEPGRIAKTLAIRAGERVLLLVTRGDARVDNAAFKAAFGAKPRMLSPDETFAATGLPVGGVCPFGHGAELPIYCDESLSAYDEVFPAGGSRSSAVRISPERLAAITDAQWVAVCRLPDEHGGSATT